MKTELEYSDREALGKWNETICGLRLKKPAVCGTISITAASRRLNRHRGIFAMLLSTNGLILREQNTGEDDRIITILTKERGVIRAFANKARRIKSKNTSATSLLSYSRLTLYFGRDKYTVNEAEPIEVFFHLREDLVLLSLAQYFCELCLNLAPKEEDAEETLRFVLNTLSMLAREKRPPAFLKPVFELRLLSMAGYMPDLTMCEACGCYEAAEMQLLLRSGRLRCMACGPVAEPSARLPKGVLFAMRHIVYAEPEKLFSFSLPEKSLKILSDACERYLLAQIDRGFPTLQFYHGLVDFAG